MNILASQAYRILVPKFIRKRILARTLRRDILGYYESLPGEPPADLRPVLDYLRSHPVAVFPYEWQERYKPGDVSVFRDKKVGLPYVMHEGRRLYFKRRWGHARISELYCLLLKEQDPRSPHRYTGPGFEPEEGDLLVDVGCAEGNFALSVAEKASRILLLEGDKEWMEPLKATFSPWKDKVTILNRYAGEVSKGGTAALDDVVPVSDGGVFLKIDVEGAEAKVLKGADKLLSGCAPLKVVASTYHRQEDERELPALLMRKGLETSSTPGYMLFFYDKKIQAPYFRRGLVRAVRR